MTAQVVLAHHHLDFLDWPSTRPEKDAEQRAQFYTAFRKRVLHALYDESWMVQPIWRTQASLALDFSAPKRVFS
jgi:hypothetical protein